MAVTGVDIAGALARAGELADSATAARRAILGISGAPGAGKSTVAAAVVAHLGPQRAVVVGMDGFHLSDDLLRALGRWERKGAPDTFDAEAYADLLQRLRVRGRAAFAPVFDRSRELAEVGAMLVPEQVPLVVTEGNYLLLDSGPWAAVRQLLDESWYVAVDEEVRRARLRQRHEAHGRSPGDAAAKTWGSDEANARVVAGSRHLADVVLSID